MICIFFIVLLLNKPSSGYEELNSEMAYFPEGEFVMGSPKRIGKKNEHPEHKVYLNAFYIDRYEVTFSAFEQYLALNLKKHPTITGWIDRKARPNMKQSGRGLREAKKIEFILGEMKSRIIRGQILAIAASFKGVTF